MKESNFLLLYSKDSNPSENAAICPFPEFMWATCWNMHGFSVEIYWRKLLQNESLLRVHLIFSKQLTKINKFQKIDCFSNDNLVTSNFSNKAYFRKIPSDTGWWLVHGLMDRVWTASHNILTNVCPCLLHNKRWRQKQRINRSIRNKECLWQKGECHKIQENVDHYVVYDCSQPKSDLFWAAESVFRTDLLSLSVESQTWICQCGTKGCNKIWLSQYLVTCTPNNK